MTTEEPLPFLLAWTERLGRRTMIPHDILDRFSEETAQHGQRSALASLAARAESAATAERRVPTDPRAQ